MNFKLRQYLGEATTVALRFTLACSRMVGVAGLLCQLCTPVRADDPPQYGWREVWAGADVSSHNWLLYSGATIAPNSDMFSDGLRLRAATGYGQYRYSGVRGGALQSFTAQTFFTDALVGYLKRLGPLTAKAFVGVSAIRHDISPIDPDNPVQGVEYGPKAVAELWLNMGSNAWSSLDLNWTSAYETYAGRVRTGYRVFEDVSIGLETLVNGNELDKDARWGAFVRYAWETGEISLAGGIAGHFFDDANAETEPYATINWLMQY